MQLRIDPEFESQIPPLDDDELKKLEANILADGVVFNPIIVWDGVIVDGHNRFHIIEKHPHIKFTTHERNFNNRHEALAWICQNQLGRRNLTPEQKKYLIGKQYEAEKSSHGATHFQGNQHAKVVSGQNDHSPEMNTRKRIAKENNKSDSYVRRAEHFAKGVDIADEVEPGIRREILSGAIKATEKEIKAIAKAAPEERPALVEELHLSPDKRKKILPDCPVPTVEQIANDIPDDRCREAPEDMLYELEGALHSFSFRWSVCLSHNRDYFTQEEHKTKINQLAKNGIDYLNQILKGEIPL